MSQDLIRVKTLNACVFSLVAGSMFANKSVSYNRTMQRVGLCGCVGAGALCLSLPPPAPSPAATHRATQGQAGQFPSSGALCRRRPAGPHSFAGRDSTTRQSLACTIGSAGPSHGVGARIAPSLAVPCLQTSSGAARSASSRGPGSPWRDCERCRRRLAAG